MTTSAELFDLASRHIPGGVNSPVRAFKGLHRPPVFMERAQGAFLFDVEGNRYVDYVGSWGPMITGHADQDVLAAVRARLDNGLSFHGRFDLRHDSLHGHGTHDELGD